MNAIEINHLTIMVQGFMLKDMTLALPQGCVMGLIGRNGAGKTTLMKAILDGYERIDGEVLFFGKHLNDEREELLNSTAFMQENFTYSLNVSIKRLKKMYKHSFKGFDTKKFDAYCDAIQIDQKKSLIKLSLGEKKLVELYFALSRNVKLLILDEPMANLDPVIRRSILQELHTFMLDESHSILISSHITSDLEKLIDYVCFIDRGSLRLQGAIDQIKEEYVEIREANVSDRIKEKCIGYIENEQGFQGLCHRELAKPFDNTQVDLESMLYYLSGGSQE